MEVPQLSEKKNFKEGLGLRLQQSFLYLKSGGKRGILWESDIFQCALYARRGQGVWGPGKFF